MNHLRFVFETKHYIQAAPSDYNHKSTLISLCLCHSSISFFALTHTHTVSIYLFICMFPFFPLSSLSRFPGLVIIFIVLEHAHANPCQTHTSDQSLFPVLVVRNLIYDVPDPLNVCNPCHMIVRRLTTLSTFAHVHFGRGLLSPVCSRLISGVVSSWSPPLSSRNRRYQRT
jgi:hypothetical protein